jgi:hypothetical protein
MFVINGQPPWCTKVLGGQQGLQKAYLFLETMCLSGRLGKKMQEPKVVTNLTWIGFMELFAKRFMPEY